MRITKLLLLLLITQLSFGQKKTSKTLKVTPLDMSAEQGNTTFMKKDQTLFYYNMNENKGEIKINNKSYTLNKKTENNGVYRLSGKGISITTSKCNFKKMESEDCFYGKFPTVKIKLGTRLLNLKNVNLQDCPPS